ncbi:MAG: hypothetical protein NTW91_09120 [Verrucomicrobia bacterium]|nr:hypothetical protein [Verrucomicrobiota bacterium]
MKIRIKAGHLKNWKALPLLLGLLMGRPLIAQEGGAGGGLGAVSTCPAAPEIAATAIAFALSPQSGLNGAQATAQIRNIVQQAARSAPYLPAQIATASFAAISKAATDASAAGQSLPTSSSSEGAKTASAQQSITSAAGFQEAIASITAGVISGTAGDGHDVAGLAKICTAIAAQLVTAAGEQAAKVAVMKQEGKLTDSTTLPMGTVEDAVAAAKAFVAAATSMALQLGFSPAEVGLAINTAAVAAKDAAAKIAQQVAGNVAGNVASQVAGQVAGQVAAAVSQSIAASTATTTSQNNSQNAPNPTDAGLPGQSQDPFVGPPPIPRLTPIENPTLPPFPKSTPPADSRGGPK